jgi:hypothetical protein
MPFRLRPLEALVYFLPKRQDGAVLAVSQATQIIKSVGEVGDAYHRLILLVGPKMSGKTMSLIAVESEKRWPRININLTLSERLLDLTVIQRAVRIPSLIEEIIRAHGQDVVLLDNIEMLFSTELTIDPFRLLQNLARHRTIVAAWPGTFETTDLTYAEPGHREFRKISRPQAAVLLTNGDSPYPNEGVE